MKKPLFATLALVVVLLVTSVEVVGGVSVVHRENLSAKQVSRITELFTAFKLKNHEFKSTDRVTLEVDKSIFAATYKKSKPGLKNYLAERYNSRLYVFATFSLMPHD